jgi:translation initiation factor IF-2
MAAREQSSVQLAEQEARQRQREKKTASEEDAAADDDAAAAVESGVLYQNFTVKADVVGSVEAVCGSILELGNNEVQPKILRSAAGQISESDIDHAAASKSVIINFNIPILPHIKQRAEESKVKILDHNVIYHVVDDAKAALSELLPIHVTYRVSGEADVLQVFPINMKKRVFRNIAGCRVRNGSIKKSSMVKVLRKGKAVFDGKFFESSLGSLFYSSAKRSSSQMGRRRIQANRPSPLQEKSTRSSTSRRMSWRWARARSAVLG